MQIVNPLPMHHVHGVVNILGCAMWSGAECEFLPPQASPRTTLHGPSGPSTLCAPPPPPVLPSPPLCSPAPPTVVQARQLWGRLEAGGLTLFMAVPTIYHKMIQEYDTMTPAEQAL